MAKRKRKKKPNRPPPDARAEAAYRYFESLGPGRTLDRVVEWDIFASRSSLERWAREFKWWERAQKYDDAERDRWAKEHRGIVDYTRNLMARGIIGEISSLFRVESDGKVRCALEIKDWDDLTKALRLLDYVGLEGGDRDPGKLADAQNNLHMLVVQALDGRSVEPGVFFPGEVIPIEGETVTTTNPGTATGNAA